LSKITDREKQKVFPSELAQYQLCPENYKEKYLIGANVPFGDPADFGILMHTELEKFVLAQNAALRAGGTFSIAGYNLEGKAKAALAAHPRLNVLHWYEQLVKIIQNAERHVRIGLDNLTHCESWMNGLCENYKIGAKLDLGFIFENSRAHFIDYKCGMSRMDEEEAKKHPQTLHYALCGFSDFPHLQQIIIDYYYPFWDCTVSVKVDRADLPLLNDMLYRAIQQMRTATEFPPRANKCCEYCHKLKHCAEAQAAGKLETMERKFEAIKILGDRYDQLVKEVKESLDQEPGYFENTSLLAGWQKSDSESFVDERAVKDYFFQHPQWLLSNFEVTAKMRDAILRDIQPTVAETEKWRFRTNNSGRITFGFLKNTSANRAKFEKWLKEKQGEREQQLPKFEPYVINAQGSTGKGIWIFLNKDGKYCGGYKTDKGFNRCKSTPEFLAAEEAVIYFEKEVSASKSAYKTINGKLPMIHPDLSDPSASGDGNTQSGQDEQTTPPKTDPGLQPPPQEPPRPGASAAALEPISCPPIVDGICANCVYMSTETDEGQCDKGHAQFNGRDKCPFAKFPSPETTEKKKSLCLSCAHRTGRGHGTPCKADPRFDIDDVGKMACELFWNGVGQPPLRIEKEVKNSDAQKGAATSARILDAVLCPFCRMDLKECNCSVVCEDEDFIEFVVGEFMSLGNDRTMFDNYLKQIASQNPKYPKGSYRHYHGVLMNVKRIRDQHEMFNGGAA
jgi:hypothetical protein